MTDLDYFERLYRDDPDPWGLVGAPYEWRKRAITMASLPRRRYATGFEPACASGQLTALLADRCDRLVALDPIDRAVAQVRERALPNVEARQGLIPEAWPDEPLDLVVLAEVLYFLHEDDRAAVAQRTVDSLTDDGHVMAVHWRHDFEESASVPEAAHADLHTVGLRVVVEHLEHDFRLEVFARA